MVKQWGGCATQSRISRIEMLVAMDRQRTLLDKARTDAVRALAVFAPDRAGPQSPVKKRRIVSRCAAPLDWDTFPICKQYTTTNSADHGMESVEGRLGDMDERLNFFTGPLELGIG
jgi:hypothetical protein